MKLSKAEIERYKKHLQLHEVGEVGQEKLKQASVLVVGAGGLGSPVLYYLTGAGIGRIGIVDDDKVSLSNLPRQVVHNTGSLGGNKVDSALDQLSAMNPEVIFDVHTDRLTRDNAEYLIRERQVVVDCTDNLETRFLLNEVCAHLEIPLVYGAVFEFEGQVSVFDAKRGPCLRCMIQDIPQPGAVPDPERHGLLNTVPGVIGMLQATEVLKLLLGIGEPLFGKLVLYDSLTVSFQQVNIRKRPDCPVCGKNSHVIKGIGIMENKVLLAVLAHPDDETFGTGGTLAYYASKGVEVHLVCATRGEAGEVDPGMLEGYGSIGELREHELRCAASHLGLKGVYFLDFRDSGMEGSPDNQHPQALVAADLDVVAGKVVRYIRNLKPQVVVTFDPVGGYMHPDHIAIHKATVRAFHAAGDGNQFPSELPAYQPARLYYHTFPRGFLRMTVAMMRLTGRDPRKFGKNGDIDLVRVSEARFPVNASIDYRSVLEKKNDAVACHASQGGMRITVGFLDFLRKLFGVSDQYMQAFPPPSGRRVKDLFANLD